MDNKTTLKAKKAIKELAKCIKVEDAELVYLIRKGMINRPFANDDFVNENEKEFISAMENIFGYY